MEPDPCLEIGVLKFWLFIISTWETCSYSRDRCRRKMCSSCVKCASNNNCRFQHDISSLSWGWAFFTGATPLGIKVSRNGWWMPTCHNHRWAVNITRLIPVATLPCYNILGWVGLSKLQERCYSTLSIPPKTYPWCLCHAVFKCIKKVYILAHIYTTVYSVCEFSIVFFESLGHTIHPK